MKKYLLNIGAFIAILGPIATVVSCKKTQDKINNKDDKNKGKSKEKGDTNSFFSVAERKKRIDDNFGLGNYKNPTSTNSQSLNENEHKYRKATGEPFAPHFHPRDVTMWDPDKYEEGDYIRSSVPLAKRELTLEIITKTKNKARFYTMDTMRGGTSAAPVGTLTKGVKDSQIMQGLQYMTDMIAFGGSSGEGLVYLPRAQDIDAYHRMGVKVHACIFFPIGDNGGSMNDYLDLIGGNPEKAADQLVKMAKYYGFDGWFINDENSSPPGWTNFMKIWHAKAKKAGIEISYYTNNNGGDVYRAGEDAYDVWFNDYDVQQGTLGNVGLKPKGFNEFTHPLGFAPGSNKDGSFITGKGKSFWLYRPWENGSYYKNEDSIRTLYNGVDASKKIIVDPRLSANDSLSKYYREYTPFISHNSFSTSFNKGEGDFFNVNGTTVKSKFFDSGYSNMSLQDYLPTWKYIVDVAGLDGTVDKNKIGNTGITIDHKETRDAWFGSDALVYNGTIQSKKMITNKLFASNIKIEEKDNFSIMYKGDVIPSLAVWTKEGDKFKVNILEAKLDNAKFSNGYHKANYDLTTLKGKQMTSFGTAFKNNGDKILKLNNFVLGKMSFNVGETKSSNKTKVKNFVNGGEWLLTNGKNIRLKWKIDNKNIKGYFIYKNNDKFNNKELIGIANTPATLLKGLDMEKISHISIIPFNNNNDLFSEIKVNIDGKVLDFSDDTRWTHKILGTSQYGIGTGHGFVGKTLDNEGGTYLVNDQIKIMHINKNGVLEQTKNYAQIIFPGTPSKGNNEGWDGASFSALFIGKTKKIFISRRYGGNGLFVFEKDMKKTNNEWLKFKEDNSIFNGKDNNGEMEYVAKMFQDEKGSLILISSLGNLRKISENGILDKTYNETLDANNKNEITKISTIKLGKNIIINYHFESGKKTFEKIINENNIISDIAANNQIGYVLDSKEFKKEIVLSTLELVDKHFEVFIKVYDKKQGKIIKSAKVLIKEEGDKNSDRFVSVDEEYYNAFTLSSDGKHLIFRALKNHHGGGQNYMPKFVLDSSYILVISISKILEKSLVPIPVKAIYVKHSYEDDFSSSAKKYGGDFRVMTAINGLVYYGTSDFGRVGAIRVNYGDLEKTSLVEVSDVIYKFKKPDGKNLTIATVKSFKGKKALESDKTLINPKKIYGN